MDSHVVKDTKNYPKNSLFCLVCYKNFESLSKLKKHMKIHPGDFEECIKSYPEKIRSYIRKVNQAEERPYKCSLCDKSFAQKCDLCSHQVTHAQVKSYTCLLCEESFAQKSDLHIHQLTHTDSTEVRFYTCTLCYLENHPWPHTKQGPFGCPMCNKHFVKIQSYDRHKKRIHSETQKWKRWYSYYDYYDAI